MLRVMLDTNILFSALFYPSATTKRFFKLLLSNHRAVLCGHVAEELRRTAWKKAPQKAFVADVFLEEFPHELIAVPEGWDASRLPPIRDANDAPILAAAIEGNVDVLVTGDKDFLALDIAAPKIMTMAEFIAAHETNTKLR